MTVTDGGCMHCLNPDGTRASLGCRCACHLDQTKEQRDQAWRDLRKMVVRAAREAESL